MISYFKDVNELAEWLPWTVSGEQLRKSYVREDQKKRAGKAIEERGYLLSYISGLKCWAGIFMIEGAKLRKSDDSEFPFYFDVKPVHVLRTPAKCFLVRESKIRSGQNGRGIYNHIRDSTVCKRICSRIEIVDEMAERDAESEAGTHSEFKGFRDLWDEVRQRSTFQRSVIIERSGGRCSICGVTKQEWTDRIQARGKWPQGQRDIERIRESPFPMLHAHHLEWVKDGGSAILDNLIAVCPNCHDLLTRGGSSSTR